MVIPRKRVGSPRVTHPCATNFAGNKFLAPFVRLACIRHAASVRPEPGSNSHESSWVSWLLIFLLTVFYPACLQCLEFISIELIWFLNQNPYTFWCLSLFSFQWAFVAPLKWQLLYITTRSILCQTFFITFLMFFSFDRMSFAGQVLI